MIEPLRISQDVACSAQHAFATWTERFGAWWPRGHTATGEAGTQVVPEPRDGGRISERTRDGREVEWGRITWEPLGDEGPGWRDANTRGWGGLLAHFTAACAA